jgi:hypothetical protein
MNISSIGSAPVARPVAPVNSGEAAEAAGAPHTDGDADDIGAAVSATPAPAPAGTGTLIDKLA